MMPVTTQIVELERDLNSFDPLVRSRSFSALLALADEGVIECRPFTTASNLHCHSFHSYNAYGFSPSALAWIARREGIRLMGIVDFDLLDGVDEFMAACESAGVHATAGIETRVWLPELAGQDINSPGEPGVAYMMGIGFTCSHPVASARPTLELLHSGAQDRNRSIIERINARLPELAIDYNQDVLLLSPSATPTERHIVQAYALRAETIFRDPAAGWSEMLEDPCPPVPAGTTARDPDVLKWLRSRLVKQGGIGYSRPGPDTFPPADTFIRFVEESSALPCAAWLDGTSEGERDPDLLLDLLVTMGIVVLNVIPDRNWNFSDPEEREEKTRNLHAIITAARKRGIPVIAGSEMNTPGQKLVDEFNSPALAPLRQTFTDGAWFVRGHTVMQHAAGMGWWSDWAVHHLLERADRISFFTLLGRSTPSGQAGRKCLEGLDKDLDPAGVLARISDGRNK